MPFPVRNAIQGDAQSFVAFRRLRVVKTYALDVASVAGAPRICYDDIVKGPLFGTTSGQSNHYHGRVLSGQENEGRDFTPDPGITATAFERPYERLDAIRQTRHPFVFQARLSSLELQPPKPC